jgi:hypothetical protein
VAFVPEGTRACITCGILNSIYILDTTTGNVIATIPSDGPLGWLSVLQIRFPPAGKPSIVAIRDWRFLLSGEGVG